jgi:tetratricopeptide (TPR) repeat protein
MEDIKSKLIQRIATHIKDFQYDDALKDIKNYWRAFRGKDKERILFLKGYLSLKTGKPEEARKIFSRLLKNAPNKSIYHFFLGLSNIELVDYKESLENFSRALSISPESFEYLKNYGWSMVMLGKKKGLSILKKLYDKNSEDIDLLVKYIFALLKFNKVNQAKWLSEIALRKYQDEELQDLLGAIKDFHSYESTFLSENEAKVLLLLQLKSGLESEVLDGLTILFLTLKDGAFKRIVKPHPWAAALEITGRLILGDGKVNVREICKKYNVKEKQVDRILKKILEAGVY